MGPHFERGAKKIGRERLPVGRVAILNDPQTFVAAMEELLAWATQPDPKQTLSIVYRVSGEGESQAYLYKLREIHGVENYGTNIQRFALPARRWHIIDSEHIAHVMNRHLDKNVVQKHGHLPITREDFFRIPEIMDPRNIVSFEHESARLPRIVYELRAERGIFVAVQELRARSGMIFKTLYRRGA
jgi:hypothetical protein